jgi:hypothetical protein
LLTKPASGTQKTAASLWFLRPCWRRYAFRRNVVHANDYGKTWMALPAIVFSIAGAASLVITNIIVVPVADGSTLLLLDKLWFSFSPMILLLCIFFPMLTAGFATYRWLWSGSKIFSGWMNVAMASWLVLAINPVGLFLAIATFLMFWLVSFCVFISVGLAMSIVWRVKNA